MMGTDLSLFRLETENKSKHPAMYRSKDTQPKDTAPDPAEPDKADEDRWKKL